MYVKTFLGLLALAGLLVATAPNERAQASSLSSPGAVTAVQDNSSNLTTEVRWHSHYGWHRQYGWNRHYGWHRHYGWQRRHWRHW
jgi:hypothetical protein